MAQIRSTAIRNFIGTVVAVIIIIWFIAAISAVMDWNVPFFTDLGRRMGL